MIRNVDLKDALAIAQIYNYYIENTIVTFDETPIDKEFIIKKINSNKPNLPWIVYEEENEIVGYAYASEWKSRSAYKYSVESSIYLLNTKLKKGIGTQLYTALIHKITQSDIHVIIGGISLPNEASIKLHKKLGFEKVAHFKEVGYKFGHWIDVQYWQCTHQKS